MVDPNVRPSIIGDADTYRRRLRRVLGRSDVVKVSEEDLAWLEPQRSAADAARMLLQAGPRVVLLTRGADGVQVVTGAGDVPVPAPDVEVVDTIGAGDAFGGGFLAWWRAQGLGREQLGDQDAVVEAAAFGALVAARTVRARRRLAARTCTRSRRTATDGRRRRSASSSAPRRYRARTVAGDEHRRLRRLRHPARGRARRHGRRLPCDRPVGSVAASR